MMMKVESLINEIAELRAQNAAILFILTSFLENQGADADALIRSIDGMQTVFANHFEAVMRKAEGLEPRSELRKPMMQTLDEIDLLRKTPWSKMTNN